MAKRKKAAGRRNVRAKDMREATPSPIKETVRSMEVIEPGIRVQNMESETERRIEEQNRSMCDSISRMKEIVEEILKVDEGTHETHGIGAIGKIKEWAKYIKQGKEVAGIDQNKEMEKTKQRGSAWDKFDITKLRNAGSKLNFFKPEIKEGISIGKIGVEDIQSEVNYWNSAVVCYILGANPPFHVLDGFFRRIWGQYGVDKVLMMKNGLVLVRFHTAAAREEILEIGVFHFDSKPVIVGPWTDQLHLMKGKVDKVPIWVQFINLELKYWGDVALGKIASLVGTPIMADKFTKQKERINYARILVEVDTKIMPEVVYFENEKGIIIEQEVKYEWKPVQCQGCNGFGHEKEQCKKKTEVKLWKPKRRVVQGDTENREEGQNQKGFQDEEGWDQIAMKQDKETNDSKNEGRKQILMKQQTTGAEAETSGGREHQQVDCQVTDQRGRKAEEWQMVTRKNMGKGAGKSSKASSKNRDVENGACDVNDNDNGYG